jgi:hypothetical protein
MSGPTMRVLSLGAGVQSTTLALLSANGELPLLDAAIFADTGAEPQAVYDHLDRLEREVLEPAGIPLYRVSNGRIQNDVLDPNQLRSIPGHTIDPDTGERGLMRRACTQVYKLQPIMGQVRLLLGATVGKPTACSKCRGTGERIAPWRVKRDEHIAGPCSVCDATGEIHRIGQPPTDTWAEQWIGFSTDEVSRVNDRGDTRYSRSRYPLLELGMSRVQCEAYLKSQGWTSVEKSACWMCPFHGNREWRRIRDTDPESWTKAVAFDRAYRRPPGMRHKVYLHISRRPLGEAPIDRVRPSDYSQPSLLDAVYEADLERAENGDPDGCSPWGCRSGEPVQAASSPAA